MDEFTEVSWSDVCRNAILEYIKQRGGDYKIVDAENLTFNARIDFFKKDNGRIHMIQIHNQEEFELILDRILYGIQFRSDEKNVEVSYNYSDFVMRDVPIGSTYVVASRVEMDDEFKPILELIEKNVPIECRVHGDCFFNSKQGIIKSAFFVETQLEVVR